MNKTDRWCAAFPGREAAAKGLDNSFYQNFKRVKLIFEEASDYFKKDIAKICYSSDQIQAKWQTIGLVIHCYSIYHIVIEKYGLPNALAGYSQGEFTACAASGIAALTDILGLIKQLEKILESTKTEDEGMYRMVDIDTGTLEKCCKQVDQTGLKLNISSYVSDTQNIISGKKSDMKEAITLAKKQGARWAINLNSDRAYHSPLCNAAAQKAKKYFNNVRLSETFTPVYSCYDGEKSTDSETIFNQLSKQINHPIRWKKIVKNLIGENSLKLIELGPGCTISANSRISDERMNCVWIGTVTDLWS